MTSTTAPPDFPPMMSSTSELDFLRGGFTVVSRRLREPRDRDSGWVSSRATSVATIHFAGAVSVDELWFADDQMYCLSLRLFHPAPRKWTVYWIDSRTGRVEGPLAGQWSVVSESTARWERREPVWTLDYTRSDAVPTTRAGRRSRTTSIFSTDGGGCITTG